MISSLAHARLFAKRGRQEPVRKSHSVFCGPPAHPSTKATNSVSNTTHKKHEHNSKPSILTSPKMTHPALTDDRSQPTTKSS